MQPFLLLTSFDMLNEACVRNFEAPGAARTGLDSTIKLPSGRCCSTCVSMISSTSTPTSFCYLRVLHACLDHIDCSLLRQQAITLDALTYDLFNKGRGFQWGREGHSSLSILPGCHNCIRMVTAMMITRPDAAIFPNRLIYLL